MNACPERELLLHAYVDAELDARSGLELEAHVAGCQACAAELEAIRRVRAALAAQPLGYAAPTGLLARVEAAIAAERPPRGRPRGARTGGWLVGGAIGSLGALAASLVLFALAPRGASLESQLIDAQARSLEAQHLVDIPTSDRHVVKPWFNGKVDFAPPVVDLAGQGFPLAGGRMDRLDGRRVAALVFHRRSHVINLFIWPGAGPAQPGLERQEGYGLVHWGAGGLTFWAVSDVDPHDLQAFAQAYRAATP
jgi:anti-sigma factor RsiW